MGQEHDLEVQFVADSSLALANTEAARQTRRLTTLLVAKKHIFNHRWVLTEREHILPNDVIFFFSGLRIEVWASVRSLSAAAGVDELADSDESALRGTVSTCRHGSPHWQTIDDR